MISREEIQNLAVLARLKLTEAETATLQKDMSNILDYIAQVGAAPVLDGGGKVPRHRNILREDTERSEGDMLAHKREALLEALPKREGDYNVVRKIIDKQSE